MAKKYSEFALESTEAATLNDDDVVVVVQSGVPKRASFSQFRVSAGGGDLLSTNNLSDLDDIPTARTNLGLGTAATSDNEDFQAPLVSGTNIKTINGQSVIGSGDLVVSGGSGDLLSSNNLSDLDDIPTARVNLGLGTAATSDNEDFQAPLVSGTNIKTINGQSVIGSGDLVVSGGSGDLLSSNNLSDLDDIPTARVNLGLGTAATSDNEDFQATLVSGSNIKTINGQSVIGSGDLVVSGGSGDLLSSNNLSDLDDIPTARTNLGLGTAATSDNEDFQAPLVSGTNIKTINGQSVIGSGDLVVSGGSGDLLSSNNLSDLDDIPTARVNLGLGTAATSDNEDFQAPLVSGTNIKTINGQSVIGSGDLVVSGGGLLGVICAYLNGDYTNTNTDELLRLNATSGTSIGAALVDGFVRLSAGTWHIDARANVSSDTSASITQKVVYLRAVVGGVASTQLIDLRNSAAIPNNQTHTYHLSGVVQLAAQTDVALHLDSVGASISWYVKGSATATFFHAYRIA